MAEKIPDECESILQKAMDDFKEESAVKLADLQVELDNFMEIKRTTNVQIQKLRKKMVSINRRQGFLNKALTKYKRNIDCLNLIKKYKGLITCIYRPFNGLTDIKQTKTRAIFKIFNSKGKFDKYNVILTPIEYDLIIIDNKLQLAPPNSNMHKIVYDYINNFKTVFLDGVIYKILCNINEFSSDNPLHVEYLTTMLSSTNILTTKKIRINVPDVYAVWHTLTFDILKSKKDGIDRFYFAVSVLTFEPMGKAKKL